jgi:hypothetical protein
LEIQKKIIYGIFVIENSYKGRGIGLSERFGEVLIGLEGERESC